MISILLTALTENFQQPLMAPAINSSVITKLSMSLRLITTLTTQLLTVYYSINDVFLVDPNRLRNSPGGS